jgi:hypothetical protein
MRLLSSLYLNIYVSPLQELFFIGFDHAPGFEGPQGQSAAPLSLSTPFPRPFATAQMDQPRSLAGTPLCLASVGPHPSTTQACSVPTHYTLSGQLRYSPRQEDNSRRCLSSFPLDTFPTPKQLTRRWTALDFAVRATHQHQPLASPTTCAQPSYDSTKLDFLLSF